MIKNFVFALCALVFATSMMAQSGKSCDDPIPVDSNYEGVITEPGEYWFTAWTYDLPLNVHFSPDAEDSRFSPDVYVDFSCVSGVYDDYKLDSVINSLTGIGFDLPVEFACSKVFRNDKVEWDLSISKMYRENLTEVGVTHNVKAYVRVVFSETGKLSLKPDSVYQSCIDNSDLVTLGDTFDILPNDSARVFRLPYSEWKNDSIRIVWTGETPATVWVADGTCEFTPISSSVYVRKQYPVSIDAPFNLQSEDLKSAVQNWLGGGVFFGKVLSSSKGQLVFEKIPMGPIQGGAILLQHDVPVQLAANDMRVFCFPRTWTSTEFVAPTQFVMNMFVSNTSEFTPSLDDANVLNKYAFSIVDGKRVAQLSTTDISNISTTATDDYVYVRFACNQATTLTPLVWAPTSCADQSILIHADHVLTVAKKPNKTIFRLRYDNWKDYNMTLKWAGTSANPTYFADACDFTLSSTNSHVLTYKSIKAKGSLTLTPENMQAWASGVDEDGFIYVRFNPNNQGRVTFTTSKPAEVDPEIPVIPTSPCVSGSIELKAGDQLMLNLDSAFTVYRIKYAEFAAQDRTLTWTGAEPLHTFVAETCTFAVAPYNRYVHVYVPVRDEEVLTAAKLAELAEFVDEDGYLYIRFLTEKEGVLTVE